LLGKGIVTGSTHVLKLIVEIFFHETVFNQSQDQEWEMGDTGVAGQPGIKEQRGNRGSRGGISTSKLGW